MSLSNFDRFFSLLSPDQQRAMDAICAALREDPTCLDTHHSGCADHQMEDKKEVADGL